MPSMEDDQLLARLAALKAPTASTTSITSRTSPGASPPKNNNTKVNSPAAPKQEEDLAARFLRLGGRIDLLQSSSIARDKERTDAERETPSNLEDERTMEDLMAEVKRDAESMNEVEGWEDDGELDKLVEEARGAVRDSKQGDHVSHQDDDGVKGTEDEEKSEEQESVEYIQRALEEAALEEREQHNHDSTNSKETDENENEEEEPSFLLDLPSVPKTLSNSNDTDENEEVTLTLPSAPTTQPSTKPVPPSVPRPPPKFTDEQIDSWCIICQDDATLKCFGCEGDLYCETCWREGHTGEDAGWEEKRHRCVQYSPPAQKRAVAS